MATEQKSSKRVRPTVGTNVIWPHGLQLRYGVSGMMIWKWQKDGKLPARDVFVGGRAFGWKPETIERAEQGAELTPDSSRLCARRIVDKRFARGARRRWER
jgi:hypothetical protein